jgi:uncharacterized membrane protein
VLEFKEEVDKMSYLGKLVSVFGMFGFFALIWTAPRVNTLMPSPHTSFVITVFWTGFVLVALGYIVAMVRAHRRARR